MLLTLVGFGIIFSAVYTKKTELALSIVRRAADGRQVRLVGDSYFSVLLVPLVELPLGTVSVRASDCEVNNLNVRTKGPRGVGVLVQGAASQWWGV